MKIKLNGKELLKPYIQIEKIFGSCDICNKKSSFDNRLCNKCFYKLMSDNE